MARHLLGTAATLALLTGPALAQEQASQGSTVTVQQCAPVISVTQTPPTVTVTLSEDGTSEPTVTVTQSPPEVTVENCAPTISGPDGAEMAVEIVEAEPNISIIAADTAELTVSRMGAEEAGAEGQAAAIPAAPESTGTTDDPVTADAPESSSSQTSTSTQAAQNADASQSSEAANQAMGDTDEGAPATAGAPATQPATEETAGSGSITETHGADNNTAVGQGQAGAESQQSDNGEEPPATEASVAEEVSPVNNDAGASDIGSISGETTAPADMPDAGNAGPEPRDVAAGSDEAAADTAAAGAPPSAGEVTAAANAIALREGSAVVEADEVMAEGMDGTPVYSADDEEVGTIEQFDTNVQAAIVGVGGFLGLGERSVALPLDQMSFQRDDAGELRAYIAVPSSEIENLPEHQAAE